MHAAAAAVTTLSTQTAELVTLVLEKNMARMPPYAGFGSLPPARSAKGPLPLSARAFPLPYTPELLELRGTPDRASPVPARTASRFAEETHRPVHRGRGLPKKRRRGKKVGGERPKQARRATTIHLSVPREYGGRGGCKEIIRGTVNKNKETHDKKKKKVPAKLKRRTFYIYVTNGAAGD